LKAWWWDSSAGGGNPDFSAHKAAMDPSWASLRVCSFNPSCGPSRCTSSMQHSIGSRGLLRLTLVLAQPALAAFLWVSYHPGLGALLQRHFLRGLTAGATTGF
jgi:hypothetical protein